MNVRLDWASYSVGVGSIIGKGKDYRLPVAVRVGMSRKISESFRQPVDGKPATQGQPMEAEARHYYNFHGFAKDITFEAFLSALSCDLGREFPNLEITLEWLRHCDRRSQIGTARRSLAKLHDIATGDVCFKVGFWETLWKLAEVFVEGIGLSYREIGTTRPELAALSKRFLQTDGIACVQHLTTSLEQTAIDAARALFLKLESLITGRPISYKAFCATEDARNVLPGPYAQYCKSATGYLIRPEALGWSFTEHDRVKAHLFPHGWPQPKAAFQKGIDPTALATAENEQSAASTALPPQATALSCIDHATAANSQSAVVSTLWARAMKAANGRPAFPSAPVFSG